MSPTFQTPFTKLPPSLRISSKLTRPLGKVSLTLTLTALEGPLFLTVIVQVTMVSL